MIERITSCTSLSFIPGIPNGLTFPDSAFIAGIPGGGLTFPHSAFIAGIPRGGLTFPHSAYFGFISRTPVHTNSFFRTASRTSKILLLVR